MNGLFNMNQGRYKGGNIEYYVESIGKGRKTGITKTFATRAEAENFARTEVAKGRGIAMGSLTDSREKQLVQKNLQVTALGKGKYGKMFTRDYGKLSMKKKKPRQQMGINFGYRPF